MAQIRQRFCEASPILQVVPTILRALRSCQRLCVLSASLLRPSASSTSASTSACALRVRSCKRYRFCSLALCTLIPALCGSLSLPLRYLFISSLCSLLSLVPYLCSLLSTHRPLITNRPAPQSRPSLVGSNTLLPLFSPFSPLSLDPSIPYSLSPSEGGTV